MCVKEIDPASPRQALDADDLIAWLNAQLDEDVSELDVTEAEDCPAYLPRLDDSDLYETDAERAARCTCPARPRRIDIAVKRAILTMHPHRRFAESFHGELRPAFSEPLPYVGCEICDFDDHHEESVPRWWCDHVRWLALPYADRPGYRQEWRP